MFSFFSFFFGSMKRSPIATKDSIDSINIPCVSYFSKSNSVVSWFCVACARCRSQRHRHSVFLIHKHLHNYTHNRQNNKSQAKWLAISLYLIVIVSGLLYTCIIKAVIETSSEFGFFFLFWFLLPIEISSQALANKRNRKRIKLA